jgi:hypothetical protein
MLDQLASVQRGAEPSTMVIDRMLTQGRRTAHYVVVTPHLSQRAAARLRLMLQRGTSMLIALVMWDGTDPLSVHRAGALGCNVIEIRQGVAMERAFMHIVGSRRR